MSLSFHFPLLVIELQPSSSILLQLLLLNQEAYGLLKAGQSVVPADYQLLCDPFLCIGIYQGELYGHSLPSEPGSWNSVLRHSLSMLL